MTEPDAPVRTRPLRADVSVVERLNEACDLSGEEAFEPASRALERIESQRSVPEARARSWALHPDTRVPVALAKSYNARDNTEAEWWWAARGARLRRTLVRRARRDAEEEGVLWTPLLDALAVRDFEQSGFDWLPRERFDVRDEEYSDPPQASPLRAVSDFLKEATEPNQVRPFLEFRYPPLLERLGRAPAGTAFEGGLLERLSRHDSVLPGLTTNPDLTDGQARRLLQLLLSWLGELYDASMTTEPEHSTAEDTSPEELGRRREVCYRSLAHLMRTHRVEWGEEEWERLLSVLPEDPSDQRRLLAGDPWDDDQVDRLLELESLKEQLTPYVVDRLHRLLRVGQERYELISHEVAPASVWKRAVARSAHNHRANEDIPDGERDEIDPQVLRHLVDSERALSCRDVQEYVLEVGETRHLAALAESDPDRKVLKRVAEKMREHLFGRGKDASGALHHTEEQKWLCLPTSELNLYLSLPVLTEEDLIDLYDLLTALDANVDRWLRNIINHPSADDRAALHVLEDTRCRDVRRWVLETERHRRSEAVQEKLIDTRDSRLLPLLARECTGDRFSAVYARYAEKDPEAAAQLLSELDAEQLEALSEDELLGHLSSENEAVRRHALRALDKVGGANSA